MNSDNKPTEQPEQQPATPAINTITETDQSISSILDETEKAIAQLLTPQINESELLQTLPLLETTYPKTPKEKIEELARKVAVIKEKIRSLNNPAPLNISPETQIQLESAHQIIGPEFIDHLKAHYEELQSLLSKIKTLFNDENQTQIIFNDNSGPNEEFICRLEEINKAMVAGYNTFSRQVLEQVSEKYATAQDKRTDVTVNGTVLNVANKLGINPDKVQTEHYADLLCEDQSLNNITNQAPNLTPEELTEKILHLVKYHIFHMRNSIAGQKFVIYETYKGTRYFLEILTPIEQTFSLLTALDHYLDGEKTLIAIKQLLGLSSSD